MASENLLKAPDTFGQSLRQRSGSTQILNAQKSIVFPLQDSALFLDLDGTLAPLMARPQLVGPDPDRNRLLGQIAEAMQHRIAIISGRSIDEIDRITGGCIKSVAGLHGLERRDSQGRYESAPPHPHLDRAIAEVERFGVLNPELLIETKRLGVALHYREAPQAEAKALAFARQMASSTGLKLQEGQMVAELRCPGPDKGDMLRAFMREQPFAGYLPIFVGDDITDEDGFVAAQALDGVGVLVASDRATEARCRLSGVDEVLLWLERSLERGVYELAGNP
jgi:trehalose 6-phosphate phosphatase